MPSSGRRGCQGRERQSDSAEANSFAKGVGGEHQRALEGVFGDRLRLGGAVVLSNRSKGERNAVSMKNTRYKIRGSRPGQKRGVGEKGGSTRIRRKTRIARGVLADRNDGGALRSKMDLLSTFEKEKKIDEVKGKEKTGVADLKLVAAGKKKGVEGRGPIGEKSTGSYRHSQCAEGKLIWGGGDGRRYPPTPSRV